MSAARRETVAKAIYDERARTGIGWIVWDQQTETVKELWRGCADAAVAALSPPREAAGPCILCDGAGSVLDGHRRCYACDGTGKDLEESATEGGAS